MPDQIDVNVHFDPPPPKKRRTWVDCIWVIFAAALIATASGQPWLFGVIAGVGIVLVIVGNHRASQPQQ